MTPYTALLLTALTAAFALAGLHEAAFGTGVVGFCAWVQARPAAEDRSEEDER